MNPAELCMLAGGGWVECQLFIIFLLFVFSWILQEIPGNNIFTHFYLCTSFCPSAERRLGV